MEAIEFSRQVAKGGFEGALYSSALGEIESGCISKGLWAKALSRSGMDSNAAQAIYLAERVDQLKEASGDLEACCRKHADIQRKMRGLEAAIVNLESQSTANKFSLEKLENDITANKNQTGVDVHSVSRKRMLIRFGLIGIGVVNFIGISIVQSVALSRSIQILAIAFFAGSLYAIWRLSRLWK